MESLILAAHAAGRTPVIAGMSLIENMRIAKECGFLPDLPPVVEAKQAKDIPLDKMLYICAGSQGNYRSGLTRIVNGENKDIRLGQGDAIIFSSQIIPGNEQKIERMQEKLRDAGVDVISSEEYLVHTSGQTYAGTGASSRYDSGSWRQARHSQAKTLRFGTGRKRSSGCCRPGR